MTLTSILLIVVAIVLIFLFIKLIVAPLLRIIIGIIIFLVIIYLLQYFLKVNLAQSFGSLKIGKWQISFNGIFSFLNYLAGQIISFIRNLIGNIF